MKTGNIERIVVESGTEPCDVDVNMLHEALLALPAEIYLRLYQMMKPRIDPGSVNQVFCCADEKLVTDYWNNAFAKDCNLKMTDRGDGGVYGQEQQTD